jgi:hypothetical protein
VTYQPSEIADLILLLALGPVILTAMTRIMPSVPRASYFAFGAMLGAYIFTIAEGFALPDVFNMLEHLCYAAAGISFVMLVLQFGRMVRAPSRRPR